MRHAGSIRGSGLSEVRDVLLQSHRNLGSNHFRWIRSVVIRVSNVLSVKSWRNTEEVRVCVVLVGLVKVEGVAREDTADSSAYTVDIVNARTHDSEISAAARAI